MVISTMKEINFVKNGPAGSRSEPCNYLGEESQADSTASAKPLSQLDQSKLRENSGR